LIRRKSIFGEFELVVMRTSRKILIGLRKSMAQFLFLVKINRKIGIFFKGQDNENLGIKAIFILYSLKEY
jgi:hypothetical protein